MKVILERNGKSGTEMPIPKHLELISKLLDDYALNAKKKELPSSFIESYSYLCDEVAKLIARKRNKKTDEVTILGFKNSPKNKKDVLCIVEYILEEDDYGCLQTN